MVLVVALKKREKLHVLPKSMMANVVELYQLVKQITDQCYDLIYRIHYFKRLNPSSPEHFSRLCFSKGGCFNNKDNQYASSLCDHAIKN